VTLMPSTREQSVRSDAALLRGAVVRPDEFREIYDRHVQPVRRFLRAQVGADLADDLTAETFAVALRRCGSYTPQVDSARAWLLGIAANLARGTRRSRARGTRALLRLPRARDGEDDRLIERLEAGATGAIGVALARLAAHEREVLVLSALGELSYDEIAVALGVPLGTVRSRLHRARASMRSALEKEDTRP
jgi:RNA polymerase sigma factor (sigma-70 family)